MSSALRLYAEDHPQLANKLSAKIEKLRTELVFDLSLAQDWPDFQKRLGVLAGLREALDICADTERELNPRD